jgi:uncharacterized lipoprotein YmbA
MKPALRTLAGIVALAVLLIGCGSSPRNNHYVLTSDAGKIPTGNTPSLGVGPIKVPEFLNRTGMVFSRDGNRLEVSSTERWAEPLEAGVMRVVAINLAEALNTQDIRTFPWDPKRAPDYGVSITLLELDANNDEASLAAEWKVFLPASGESVTRRISSFSLPLPAGDLSPDQIAPAYSELLSRLSTKISEAIKQHQANGSK